jgi:hypothetical protein
VLGKLTDFDRDGCDDGSSREVCGGVGWRRASTVHGEALLPPSRRVEMRRILCSISKGCAYVTLAFL